MLIINKNKPFYIDYKNKIIRMGNFPDTGKEIEYEDDTILSIFKNIQNPILIDDLINVVNKETEINKKDIELAIEYLKNEKIIIDYEKYQDIVDDIEFNRQDLFFSMFNDNYLSLSNSFQKKNILILGLGGIGANVAVILERAGFRNFTLIDSDVVEKSNLIRQFPYTDNDLGKLKTETMKKKLKNSKVKCINLRINTETDIINEIKSSDLVLCTVDKPQRIIRRLINKVCIKNNKPVLFCGFSEHVAIIGPFVEPKSTACLCCIEKHNTENPLNNVDIVPSFGPLCLLISSIVSNEIINYFSKFKETNLVGKTLMFNLYTYQTKVISWKKKSKCKECSNNASK